MAQFKNYLLSDTALAKIARARRAGIKIPVIAFVAAKRAGIPYWMACAFLVQESAGGQNVFGHDPSIFEGAGKVTKDKYLEYRRQRIASGNRKMQGVGPMQLTWWEFQDEADRAGGAWKPYYNSLIGFKIIRKYLDAGMTPQQAATRYNGSGPAAEAYGREMNTRFETWRRIINP